MGQPVLPPGMDLIEDPHAPRAFPARPGPFDGEGLCLHPKPRAGRGRWRVAPAGCWIWPRAASWACPVNGQCHARGTGAPPSPSTSNLDLTQGALSREDLIAQMGTGLLITSMIGSTINPTTGDYSRGAAGFWVENGQLAYPVHECTIAGNLRDMLLRIIPANDARAHLSTRVPSILIDGMILAGA
jgi:PmbA protein